MNDLFDLSIPSISSQVEFEKLKKQYPSVDLYYLATACQPGRKEVFTTMYEVFEKAGLSSKEFLKEIKSGKSGKFHQLSWEMFVAYSLIKNGYTVKRFTMKSGGLDFVVFLNEIPQFYVECTASAPGKAVSVQGASNSYITQRLANSISSKIDHYSRSKVLPNFNLELPYIIAVNVGDPNIERLSFSREDNYIVLEALYKVKTLERPNIYFRLEKGRTIFPLQGYDQEYFTGFFLSDSCKEVSAVWFSPESVLNQNREILGDANILVFNTFAKNELDTEDLTFLNKIKFECRNSDNELLFFDIDIEA